MSPSTLADFEADSAFERSTLATLFPLLATQQVRNAFDARTGTHHLNLNDATVGSNTQGTLLRLRPLFFGAAWKILDLLFEFGLNRATSKDRWAIHTKAREASNTTLPPLSGVPDIWNRLVELYRGTAEPRHCLVHRRFNTGADGTIIDLLNSKGMRLPDISPIEQAAFCRIAQRCALAVIGNSFSHRDRLDLVASLDSLASLHRLPLLGGGEPSHHADVVIVDATWSSSGWTLDTSAARKTASQRFPGRSYWDLEVHFGLSALTPLTGRLEEAPDSSALQLDPSNPPSWLR